MTGKDPKVRPSSVDVVRHWQDLGYLIIYVTGRPCMQLRKVVSWLSMHNFPQGLVSFADGFSTGDHLLIADVILFYKNIFRSTGT